MNRPPYSYPETDEVPYLEWFGRDFVSVFVALPPFLRVIGHSRWKNGNWIPDDVLAHASRHPEECAVTWSEVARNCEFPDIRYVNRALRLTGSRNLAPELSAPGDTARLMSDCAARDIYPPDEGHSTPPMDLATFHFLTALDQPNVNIADHFGSDTGHMPISAFQDRADLYNPAQWWTDDHSIFATIYIDYHYTLVCQTAQSLERASPAQYFEGFFASETTNDFWGLP
ncbi:hypothetical protein [Chachezhania sediminis]|uniref:hypothetical protein n=1 Tax=Chachezhania sediminis TaxID=2599291 RepID=UPI00131D2CF3|nr:hypothetical protein [Chachezhania sediminis]